jgi:hypothetical protein
MRRLAAALALALALIAAPAFAKKKEPRAGAFCGKKDVGTTVQSKSGETLECKASKKGRAHWTKK